MKNWWKTSFSSCSSSATASCGPDSWGRRWWAISCRITGWILWHITCYWMRNIRDGCMKWNWVRPRSGSAGTVCWRTERFREPVWTVWTIILTALCWSGCSGMRRVSAAWMRRRDSGRLSSLRCSTSGCAAWKRPMIPLPVCMPAAGSWRTGSMWRYR